MSIKDKKRILTDYYRKHGGLPKGNLDIDADTDTVGNVFVDDSYVGAFDYCKGEFISLAVCGKQCRCADGRFCAYCAGGVF